MIVWAIAALFGYVVATTGPAFQDRRARRREEQDRPLARVIYLPSAACRGASCPDPTHCAICKAQSSL